MDKNHGLSIKKYNIYKLYEIQNSNSSLEINFVALKNVVKK